LGAATHEFEANRARSGEQIQCTQAFKVHASAQQIEQALTAEIRGGPPLKSTVRRKVSALESASDYSHGLESKRIQSSE
jgi:hypothetical protein